MKQQNLKALFAFGAIYVIWGSTYLAIRYAVETIPPFMMMGTRSLIAGGILYLWSRSRENEKIQKEHIIPLFIIGAMFFLIGHGCLAWAEQFVPSGLAAVLISSEPFLIVGIEFLILRDTKINLKGAAGLILGFAGIIYLVASTKGIASSGKNIIGMLVIITGSLSWSGGAVYSRVAKLPKSALLSSGMELIIGGTLLLITSFIIGEFNQFHVSQVSTRSALSIIYLVTFGSVIAFSSYIWLLGHTSATRISTHTYVNPVIAIFLGWLIANEQITTALLAATVIIVVSVYMVLYVGKKQVA
jgi:drug/metabolite transporter (DMT)-like permease